MLPTATDLPFEVAAAVALEVLFLKGVITNIDEAFLGVFEGGRTLIVNSDLNESTKM